MKPFDRQHPIRGSFNDPREGGRVGRQFHFGVDVAAPNGTAVHAVAAGTVALESARAVAVRASDGRTFHHWHVVPAVRPGERVAPHQLLGRVEAPWAHVHFAESVAGLYLNPLRPGALGPYVDPTTPAVTDVRFTRAGRPLAFDRIGGRADLVVDAFDVSPLRVSPRWWADMPVTTAALRWPILRGRHVVQPWRNGPRLGGRFREPAEFTATYAPGRRQNHPHEPGRCCVYLARGWDASTLRPGTYEIEVEAGDTAGNRGRSRIPFRIAG